MGEHYSSETESQLKLRKQSESDTWRLRYGQKTTSSGEGTLLDEKNKLGKKLAEVSKKIDK